jgi:hypothetical protein
MASFSPLSRCVQCSAPAKLEPRRETAGSNRPLMTFGRRTCGWWIVRASVSAGVSSVDDRYGTKDVLSLSNQCIQMGDTRIPTSILLPRPCGASLAQTDREPVDGRNVWMRIRTRAGLGDKALVMPRYRNRPLFCRITSLLEPRSLRQSDS